ncbi:MAG: nicotinate-nucleotide adenylyltransferase, partial [Henriciella sp.]|uniref:nicotinate-nucleotide adenylyltransferase n=1 Tax=Henriciella sp. TaxID=1968823 RepID=UPI003C76CC00
IPARGNPLKSEPADFYERVHQIRELIGHNPNMFVSDIEHWAGLRYTVDVLAELRRHRPKARFVWLMGADSLENFHDWRDWRQIARTLPICVVSRPNSSVAALNSRFAGTFQKHRLPERQAALLPDRPAPTWVYLKAPFNATSSTELRIGAQKS